MRRQTLISALEGGTLSDKWAGVVRTSTWEKSSSRVNYSSRWLPGKSPGRTELFALYRDRAQTRHWKMKIEWLTGKRQWRRDFWNWKLMIDSQKKNRAPVPHFVLSFTQAQTYENIAKNRKNVNKNNWTFIYIYLLKLCEKNWSVIVQTILKSN